MPGYPDKDGGGRRSSDKGLPRIFRFFCTRRGVATARAAMMICAIILPVAGTVGSLMLRAAWKEFTDTKNAINRVELYVSGAVERGKGWEHRISVLELDGKVADHRIDDIDKRLYRVEGRR